jgi:membrane protein DedA with SNARE-associated domain
MFGIIGFILLKVGPVQLVNALGPRNSYVAFFLLAMIGGASSFTSSSFYASVPVFAAGGLDPVVMVLLGGPGLAVGDSFFYFLGRRAHEAFLDRYEKRIQRIAEWMMERRRIMPLIIYLYSGFSPFPGDILMVTLALLNYPYKRAILPMVAGNMTMILLLSLAGVYGVKLLGL